MKHKIGISTYKLQALYGDKGAIDVAASLGVDSIDFFTNAYYVSNPATIYSKSDDEIRAYCEELREYAASRGIIIGQTHGRMRIVMGEGEANRLCLENARRDLLATAALGAPVCAMHGVKSTTVGIARELSFLRNLNCKTYSKILEWAKEYNVKVATETSGFSTAFGVAEVDANADNFKAMFDLVSKESPHGEYFTVCLDTGHVNSVVRFGNPSVGDVIRMFRGHISCLHLHDNDGLTDQHRPILSGTIDWDDTFSALEEIGFDGVYNLEVNFAANGEDAIMETAASAVEGLRAALEKREK